MMLTDNLEMDNRRYFDLEEANALIPWLNHTFENVLRLRQRLDVAQPVQQDAVQNDIDDILNDVVARGIEVVDVEMGVVNFYAWDEDEEVILSWQYGESTIHFWHEPFEDFCHRRPLKQITTEAPEMGPAVH